MENEDVELIEAAHYSLPEPGDSVAHRLLDIINEMKREKEAMNSEIAEYQMLVHKLQKTIEEQFPYNLQLQTENKQLRQRMVKLQNKLYINMELDAW